MFFPAPAVNILALVVSKLLDIVVISLFFIALDTLDLIFFNLF